MENYEWYQTLRRPSWAPPSWIFAPVWTVLYIIIAASFGFVGYAYFSGKVESFVVLPFFLNIIFNVSFTPIQFKLKNNFLASVDILLALSTLVWSLAVVYSYYSWVSYVNIPYLLWVSFATVLQLTITYLNRNN